MQARQTNQTQQKGKEEKCETDRGAERAQSEAWSEAVGYWHGTSIPCFETNGCVTICCVA